MATGTPSIARAVLVQLGGRAIGLVASLVTVATTTRYLGVADYGLLTAAVVFVSLWSSLAELGVTTTIVRKASDGSGDLEPLVRTNIGFSLLYGVPLAALCAVVGVLALGADDRRLIPLVAIVASGLALQTMSTCVSPVFAVKVRFGPVALGDALSRVATLAAVLAVVTTDGGLVWMAAAQLVPPAATLVVAFVAARRDISVRPLFAPGPTVRLVRESLPITGVAIIGVLYWRADGFVLSVTSSEREVGAYGLASTLAFTLTVASTFYLTSSLSTMAALFPRDRGEFAALLNRGVGLMFFLAAPLVAFGAPLAGPIVALLGSQEFVGVTRLPLVLLLVAVLLTFVTGLLSQGLFAAREQRFLLRLNVVNLLVNVGLNLALDARLGAVGVGVALIVSEAAGLVGSAWRLRRVCRLRWPVAGLLRLLVPVAAGVAVLVPLRHLPVLLPLVAATATYLAVNLAVGPVRLGVLRGMFARPAILDAPVTDTVDEPGAGLAPGLPVQR